MIRLVATDLDGTLLQPDRTINAWTRSVLDACRARDVLVVPVTARQPVGLAPIAEHCGFDGWALCVNGALGIHLRTGEVLHETLLGVAEARRLVDALRVELPEVRVAAVRDRGETFAAEDGYATLASFTDHHRDPQAMSRLTLDEVLAAPNLKVVVRHPSLPPHELMRRIEALALPGFESTVSGADFVELSAAGITKATGLATLCDHLGVAPHEVVAFGDAHNDIAMLQWAGRSFAVANADEQVRVAAGAVTTANTDDGVARALMELMRAGQL